MYSVVAKQILHVQFWEKLSSRPNQLWAPRLSVDTKIKAPFMFSLAPAAELKILTPSVSRVFRLAMTLDSDPGIPNSGLYINPEILELPYVLTREWQTGPGLQVLAMTNFKMVSTKFFASSARNRLTKCKFNSGIEVHWQIPLHRVTTHLLFLKNTNAFVF